MTALTLHPAQITQAKERASREVDEWMASDKTTVDAVKRIHGYAIYATLRAAQLEAKCDMLEARLAALEGKASQATP